jgi:hypothetical protein
MGQIGNLTLENGTIGIPETSVLNYLTPRNKPEEERILFRDLKTKHIFRKDYLPLRLCPN